MASPKKAVNPFYVLLVLVGMLFTISACGYFVVSLRHMHPESMNEAAPGIFYRIFDEHGTTLLIVELAVLAVATVAAIGSDAYWENRTQQTNSLPSSDDAFDEPSLP